MTAPTTVPEALRAAAGVVAARGHCQDTYEDSAGRVCVVGALRVALFGSTVPYGYVGNECSLYSKVHKALSLYIESAFRDNCVPVYNDAPERTRQEVIDTLNAAANWAERLA